MKRSRLLIATAALLAAALTLSTGSAVPPGGPQGQLAWSPGNPQPGRDVTFSISASDPDGIVLSAKIEYGDGTSDMITSQRSLAKDATACLFGDYFVGTLKHSYARTGRYPVRLTIVSGACPLAEALQETQHVAPYVVEVVSSTAGGPATQPVEITA